MDKFWNFAETPEGNELRLDGPISSESWFGDEVTPDQFRAELAQHPGDITVWINSPGGDVFAASSIYTALKEHDGRVTVKIEALAASAASIVAMAGDEVQIAPTAFMMIHRASMISYGNIDKMRQAQRQLAEVDSAMAQIYADRTGLALDKIMRMMEAETWMNAESALTFGFADLILFKEAKAEPETDGAAARLSAAAVCRTFCARASAEELARRIEAAARPAPEPTPEPAPAPDNHESERQRIALRLKLINDQIKGGI